MQVIHLYLRFVIFQFTFSFLPLTCKAVTCHIIIYFSFYIHLTARLAARSRCGLFFVSKTFLLNNFVVYKLYKHIFLQALYILSLFSTFPKKFQLMFCFLYFISPQLFAPFFHIFCVHVFVLNFVYNFFNSETFLNIFLYIICLIIYFTIICKFLIFYLFLFSLFSAYNFLFS